MKKKMKAQPKTTPGQEEETSGTEFKEGYKVGDLHLTWSSKEGSQK